jgi:hypothetical protein
MLLLRGFGSSAKTEHFKTVPYVFSISPLAP